MSNPTRQEVKRELSKCQSDKKWGNCYQCVMGRAYLRALDMVDRIRKVLESPCGVEQRRLVLAELAKFDEKEVKQ